MRAIIRKHVRPGRTGREQLDELKQILRNAGYVYTEDERASSGPGIEVNVGMHAAGNIGHDLAASLFEIFPERTKYVVAAEPHHLARVHRVYARRRVARHEDPGERRRERPRHRARHRVAPPAATTRARDPLRSLAVSSDYDALLTLFEELRAVHQARNWSRAYPIFSARAMSAQLDEVRALRRRLRAIDTTSWSVAHRVDYYTVLAEMNGVEFDHRVLKPWARDPGFYNLTDGIYPRLLVHHSRSLSSWGLVEPELPLTPAGVDDFRTRLRIVVPLFEQAKTNLTEGAADLATIAIRVKEKDVEFLERLSGRFAEHHPELVARRRDRDRRDPGLPSMAHRQTVSHDGIGRHWQEELRLVDAQRPPHPLLVGSVLRALSKRVRPSDHVSQAAREPEPDTSRLRADGVEGGKPPPTTRGDGDAHELSARRGDRHPPPRARAAPPRSSTRGCGVSVRT